MADAMGDDELERSVEAGSRFAHLLKPIRDLAANWGVDIANDLEDYLAHLSRTGFTFDGGPRLDFAEAALVIQSSACVYSRKVDFLHTLVYQALEAVRSKRQRVEGETEEGQGEPDMDAAAMQLGTQRERVVRRGGAGAGDLPDLDDDLDGFLALGQQLKMVDDIDLQPEEDDGGFGSHAAAARAPAALLALEDHSGGAGDGDAGFYRLAQCHVHVSGGLLLDANDADAYDSCLNNTGRPPPAYPAFPGDDDVIAAGVATWAEGGAPQAPPETLLPQQGVNEADGGDVDGGGYGGGMTDDDEPAQPEAVAAAAQGGDQIPPAPTLGELTGAQGEVAPLPGPIGSPGPPGDMPQDDGGDAATMTDMLGTAPGQVTHARARQQRQQDAPALQDSSPGAAAADPWEPLDPDDPHGLPLRPIQVKRPARGIVRPVSAAHAVQQAAGRGAGRALAITLLNPEFAYGLEVARQLAPPPAEHPARGRRGSPAAGTDAPAVDGTETLLDAVVGGGAMDVDAATGLPGAVPLLGAADAEAAAAIDNDMWAAGGDAGGGDDNAGDGGEVGAWDGGLDVADIVRAGAGMDARLGIEAECDGGVQRRRPWEEEDASNEPSYEEVCRAHMEAIMAAAAAQEVQTELATCVSGWRQRIDPLLRDEEARATFDIQNYQHTILHRLSNATKEAGDGLSTVPFGAVASQQDKWEVSRVFAAMLQLINSRNVSLERLGPGGPDAPFRLQLLNSEMVHHKMGQQLEGGGSSPDGGDGTSAALGDRDSLALQVASNTDGSPELDNRLSPKPRVARRPSKKARAKAALAPDSD